MDELTPICQMKDIPLGGSTTCMRESLEPKPVTSKVETVLNVPTEELPSTEMKTPCEKCEDFDKFIDILKEKCHHTSRRKEF